MGLDVEDHVGIAGAREGGSPTGRALLLRPVTPRPRALPQTRAVSRSVFKDGSLELAVGTDLAGDFWFDAPGAGQFRLRGDGALVEATNATVPHPAAQRNRMLVGQVLPFAALLRGLEVLHATAVVLPSAAIAIHGAGRTSVALALVREGARLLDDDLLAVEPADGGVLAHPGFGTVNVSRSEADRLGDSVLAAAGSVIGEDRWSVQLRLDTPERAPARLGALYVLRRPVGIDAVVIRHRLVPDPRLILDATFGPAAPTPERVIRKIALCALAARTMRVCEVLIPPGATPAETAEAMRADAEQTPLDTTGGHPTATFASPSEAGCGCAR
jgi:hypothetical protein